jgi:hypothetical protein
MPVIGFIKTESSGAFCFIACQTPQKACRRTI